jgi:hypothetical protein
MAYLWLELLPQVHPGFKAELFHDHLPQNISKLHNNVHIFKAMLRNFLVKNAFYSSDEFLSKDCDS